MESEGHEALLSAPSLATRREDMPRRWKDHDEPGTIVDIFRQHVPIDAITVIGGGAKGAVWRQMMADIYDCRIEKLNVLEEATSMGAAVIGGVACGAFKDFEVIHQFIHVDDVAVPNPPDQAVYRRRMPIFEKCYHAMVDVFEELSVV